MSRLLWLRLLLVCLAVGVVQGRAEDLPYAQVARVPSVVDGQSFHSFANDPVENRLYAASQLGVYWVDLNEKEPRIKGPILRKRIATIEVAPEAGRLFYTTPDELGFISLRANDAPKILGGRQWRTARLAYEPTRKEMYVATRERGIVVYNTETGERGAVVEVPGWYASMMEAVPGKVFFSVANKAGLFVIDAATHTVSPWPVEGPLVTPAYLDADPTGRYLFATYDKYVVAIDVASAKVVGRLATATGGRIAFDPERRLLVVSEYAQPGQPRLRLTAYRVDDTGLVQVAELENPVDGQAGLESFRGGFLQQGYRSLLLWSATPQ